MTTIAYEKFQVLQDHVNDKHVTAQTFFIVGFFIQAAFLAVILVQVFDTQNQLKSAETTPAACPKPSYLTPVWVLLLVQAITGFVFYVLSAYMFSGATFLPK